MNSLFTYANTGMGDEFGEPGQTLKTSSYDLHGTGPWSSIASNLFWGAGSGLGLSGSGHKARYDVRGKSPITDFNVLVTGLSSPHLRALVSAVRSEMTKEGVPSYRHSGEPDSGWVVLDYVDVIVHAFTHEAREYYDLDSLFKEAEAAAPKE